MAGWMWSWKEFLDYDRYKSNISEIWDKVGLWDDEENSVGEDEDLDVDIDENEDKDLDDNDNNNKEGDIKEHIGKSDVENGTKNVIKAFPKAIKFIKMPSLKWKNKSNPLLTGYSKTDLLWVINRYIENNLSDDTDILVTVEYDEDDSTVQKIVLQAQAKDSDKDSKNTLGDLFVDSYWVNSEKMIISADEIVSENNVNNTQNVQRITTTKWTQKDQKDAEEIFSILF